MNIYIGGPVEYSDMQGPAPKGFHVPLQTEWQAIYNAYTGLGLSGVTNLSTYLKLPMAGRRDYEDFVYGVGSTGFYWSSTPLEGNANYAYILYFGPSGISTQNNDYNSYGFSVRCFKNSPTIPTSSWTKLYGTSIESGGIFWSPTEGLISISSDGSTWYTIQDKNIGATTVYNGDTLTDDNCGYLYQWGNNHGFPHSGTITTTSSTQVDVTGYGPGNYYESSTWVTAKPWCTRNANLRGGVSQGSGTKNVEVKNIYLGEGKTTVLSDMQGPAPEGFHIPLQNEWSGLYTIMSGLSLTTGDNWKTKLHIPFAGYRSGSNASLYNQGSGGYYWSSSPYGSDYPNNARYLRLSSSNVNANNYSIRADGFSVRCFKDSFEVPTSSWTVIQGTIGSAGIFWNQSDGIISITSDGSTGYTIMDKNLGATSVYNNGDTLSEANCGKYYQWGNNYGFAWTGSVTTSSTQVNAQNYGPGNYYSSSTFINRNNDWSSVHNDNLRGGTSQGTSTVTEPGIKAVYAGDTKVRSLPFEQIRPNVDVLYSGAGGIIKHGYDSNYGEILLHKSNGDELIIADRNIGANTYGTGSEAYGSYYTFGGGTAPTGYHIPTSSEINTLVNYYNSITGTATSSARDYVLMPYAGTSTSDHEYKGYYWSSTSASNGAYALIMSSQFFLGDQKMGKTALFTVRPFKDT